MPLPVSSTSSTLIWTDAWSLAVIRRLVAAPAAGSAPCSRPPRPRTLARDVEVDDLASVVLHGELGESESKFGERAVAARQRGQRKFSLQTDGLQQRAQSSDERGTGDSASCESSFGAQGSASPLRSDCSPELCVERRLAERQGQVRGRSRVLLQRTARDTRVGGRVQETARERQKRGSVRADSPPVRRRPQNGARAAPASTLAPAMVTSDVERTRRSRSSPDPDRP